MLLVLNSFIKNLLITESMETIVNPQFGRITAVNCIIAC